MYTTCTFCYAPLGLNEVLETFPVGRRVAFDPAKACVWAVCPGCTRWNLVPIEERWEVVDECERRFRKTSLRYSSGNIGLAWLANDLELVRVGPALRPEFAAWRYGKVLVRPRPATSRIMDRLASAFVNASRTLSAASRSASRRDPRAVTAQLMLTMYGSRVLDVVHLPSGRAVPGDAPVGVVRYRHLVQAALVRPEAGRPWALRIPHDHGVLTLLGDDGIRAAARALAIVNGTQRGGGFSQDVLESAVRKVDESSQLSGYFNRVLTIALRSHWGRGVDDTTEASRARAMETLTIGTSDIERLAFRLTGRTFWGHGGIGSEPSTALLDVPLVDRLALEMAAHEETERRALEGELAELADAWREAAEIAAIADALLNP
ncbi:MAG TPA: hypothetical protein VFO55_09405 [Gemmatimonadaceae bacterium]|nr:hypothetical protein [Gemmatimonadaceae bacterium]